MSKKSIIIAELGVNHNGSFSIAKKLVNAAKNSGADIAKFQIFSSSNFISKLAPKAKYQINSLEKSQLEMLKKLELTNVDFKKLSILCKKKNIEFLASIFDFENFNLIQQLKFKRIKIPSGEINNFLYLEKISRFQLPIIISTGGSCLKEVDEAISFLIKKKIKRSLITLLQCNSEYPTPYSDINLKVMQEFKKIFNVNVGLSDHSVGIEVPIAAVALGAQVIEKHLTINNKFKGPDHSSSLDYQSFKDMVNKIRNVEKSLGNSLKRVTKSEKKNIPIIRRSIVAKRNIKKNERFTINNICLKRPGYGLKPFFWNKILKKKSKKYFKKDNFISF
jgi:N,N'-diacetyllegionaminate synthase